MRNCSSLFPNKEAFIVFALYIILFVFQGVFVTASKNKEGGYAYNTILVVFLSEFLKLVISATLYTVRRQNLCNCYSYITPIGSKYFRYMSFKQKPHLLKAVVINYELLLLYFVPSLLYCFYNNLAFVNLSHYDPTSYYILLQFRVVLTAILFQFLFSRKLTSIQWVSLAILTAGCMIKNFDAATVQSGSNVDNGLLSQIFNIYFLSINFQNFCSCLAGTYNEYLLKTKGSNVDIFLQNVFMYMDSVICNFFMLMFNGQLSTVFEDFKSLGDIFVILITVNSAIVGIVTSFFLKNLNSILKTYASALELIITAVVCYIIFRIPITMFTIVSICLVSIAVAMYFKNPVNNVSVSTSLPERDNKLNKPLLEEIVTDS